MSRKRAVKRRDRFAVALQDALYRKRVVKSAKLYSRKARKRGIFGPADLDLPPQGTSAANKKLVHKKRNARGRAVSVIYRFEQRILS